MVFILRTSGGHVDVFACLGGQTSSSETPNNLVVTSNPQYMTTHTELVTKKIKKNLKLAIIKLQCVSFKV